MIVFYALVIGLLGFIFLKLKVHDRESTTPPPHYYPLWKDQNFKVISKAKKENSLPKIFRPSLFWGSHYFTNAVVIADYELIKEAFSKRELSSRLISDKMARYDLDQRIDRGVHQLAEKILGKNDTLVKATNGREKLGSGIGDGPYDDFHKMLRTKWHQTQSKLVGRNRINEMIQAVSLQVCQTIKDENSEVGFDPRDVFMNGSMNVVTGFALGKQYEFRDATFRKLVHCVKVFFENLQYIYLSKVVTELTPSFLLRKKWFRQLRYGRRNQFLLDVLGPDGFVKIMYDHIKEHRVGLDMEEPRDYLDMLLIEAETNSDITAFHVAFTIVALYLGASDTLSNTMRWLVMTLATYPEVQEKCYAEIQACITKNEKIIKEDCPYTSSVLHENLRWRNVADSLPHKATEDTYIGGYLIRKGAPIQASLTAVTQNPDFFPEPHLFKPTRFLDEDGKFVNDIRVCIFSLGLRNCIGKQLALTEYFVFATDIINNFRIIHKAGNLEPAHHASLLLPKDDIKVRFLARTFL